MATTHNNPSKAKTAANAIVTAAAIVAGIVAINIIATRVFGRLDLTENKVYTLSDTSKQVVKELPDRMTIRAYISTLPPEFQPIEQYVRDLLDEYASASNGKVTWESINPQSGTDEEKKTKLEDMKKYKITNMTVQKLSQAKLEIGSDNYLGIAFQYGGQIESIPTVTKTEGLEYEITGLIKRMVSAKKKKVGFASSEGELSPQQGLQLLSRVISEYETTTVTFDKPIPEDIDILVIAGPKQPFNDKAKYEIDQFLMKGKSVALFLDGMVVETPRGMNMPGMDQQPMLGRANDVALGEMLEKYGLKVRDDIVLDLQNTAGPVPVGGQLYLANHPVFVGVTADKDNGFPSKWAVTEQVKALILPFPSSVELVGPLKEGKVPGVTARAIAQSTPRSWRQTGFYLFNPQVEPTRPDKTESGPFTFGYVIEGKIPSAFAAGPPGSDPNVSTPDAAKAPKEAPEGTRLLVVADSNMLEDNYLQVMQAVPVYRWNLNFFLNAIDWLAKDESLISLRAKGMTARPLSVEEGSNARLWAYVWYVAGIPILLVAFGVVLWRLRVMRRRRYSL